MPVDNTREALWFSYGAVAGTIGGFTGEMGSGREPEDFGTDELFKWARKGFFAGGASGTVVDIVHELTGGIAEYGYEYGTNEIAAHGAGATVGTATGGSAAKGVKKVRNWLTPD